MKKRWENAFKYNIYIQVVFTTVFSHTKGDDNMDLEFYLRFYMKNQQRKELLNQVLGVELNSEQFKALAEKLDFRYKGRLIKYPIDAISMLGYDVEDKRIKNKRYKIITKQVE